MGNLTGQVTCSVIIPTYNRASLLAEAVNSVFAQTFLDFELIISDNHSTDNTPKLVRQLEREDSRIRYLRQPHNLGMVGNWNAALSVARGQYVVMLMDDDLLSPNFLHDTVSVMHKNKNLAFVVTQIELGTRDSNGHTTLDPVASHARYCLHPDSLLNPASYAYDQVLLGSWRVGLPSGILFRANPPFIFTEMGLDPGFWLDLLSVHRQYYYLAKPLTIKRLHSGDQFSDSRPDSRYFSRLLYLHYLAGHYRHSVKPKVTPVMLKRFLRRESDLHYYLAGAEREAHKLSRFAYLQAIILHWFSILWLTL